MYKAVLIVFVITVLITYFFANYTGEAHQLNEGWESYRRPPYGYVSTGADPIYFYRRDLYRKPYRWHLTFSSSYPYPHQQPLP